MYVETGIPWAFEILVAAVALRLNRAPLPHDHLEVLDQFTPSLPCSMGLSGSKGTLTIEVPTWVWLREYLRGDSTLHASPTASIFKTALPHGLRERIA